MIAVCSILQDGDTIVMARQEELIPGVRVTDLYGTSEPGAIAMIDNDEWSGKDGSFGRPSFFISVKIMDDDGKQLNAFEVGEVWVKKPFQMKEYYRDPQLTSETIRGDYVKTGGLGYMDEQSYLYLSGRKNTIINHSGFYIIPGEVERVLQEVPGVESVVAVEMEHPDGGKSLTLLFVCTNKSVRKRIRRRSEDCLRTAKAA